MLEKYKMDKKDLEFVLYILLGTLTGLIGLTAALFITYIANYKKYISYNRICKNINKNIK